MTNLVIEPAEGFVALEFLDDEKQDEERNQYAEPGSDSYNEALFAVCVGVGKKVTVCKRGDTVVVRAYAREGIHVSDDVVLCESYCVVGKVTTG